MGLKPDHWIRKMAREHRMIEPYADNQVRDGVISYGVSSYGYDIRVFDEFKIFTNVYSAVVDPKNFNPQSMVDFKGEVCVIPPNSFALARTVEYFRIPRKVLTVCLGKCLTGDTRLVDAETGDYLPLKDFIAARSPSTVSLQDWRLSQKQVVDHVDNGLMPVYALTTRAGLKIKATANHPFRTLQGWKALSDLLPGERIAVARSCPVFGKSDFPEHEAVILGLMLSDGQCHTPGHSPRFTNEDPVLVEALVDAAQKFGCEVSPVGKMGYNLVNRRKRGGRMATNRVYRWLQDLGCNMPSAEKHVPSVIFTACREVVRKFLQALFSGDGSLYSSKKGVFLEYSTISERLVFDLHHLLLRFGIFGLVRSKALRTGGKAYRIQITDPEMIGRYGREIGFIPGCKKQAVLEELLDCGALHLRRRSNFDTLPPVAWGMMSHAAHASGHSLRSIGIRGTQPDQSLPFATAHQATQAVEAPEFAALVDSDVIWDGVASIEPAGIEQVYDLTIPETHNFLANDFIVHNSTYARCFHGDTRVALVDGTAPTLEEMARRAEDGELFWGYSVAPEGNIIVTLLEQPRYIGRDSLLQIVLDTRQSIFCTPDHRFMTRDGNMLEADQLRPGSSLMPLYRHISRAGEMVYQPEDGSLQPAQQLLQEWKVRNDIDMGLYQRKFSGVTLPVTMLHNHTISTIREVPGDHDVYCLTVPETGNFALDAGVFVSNCGIIVNVTPFEPEWEGFVTLEISNTTPLPAKIYANEGIAQVLFFEADEECEISYADKKGKYQRQQSIELPKL